jgi:hypothetical protein
MKKPKGDPKPEDLKPPPRTIAINPKPKGELKAIGGSMADDWNLRLLNGVGGSLPDKSSDDAVKSVCHAMVDMKPEDPVEGILIAQLLAANEASLAMYRKGWAQPVEYFVARTKYLQLADKAARTVMMLTERLGHHRGRGQQQITVKHVTTNNVTADQAIIAESVATGAGRSVASPALLAASSEATMPILDQARLPDPVGVGGVEKKK